MKTSHLKSKPPEESSSEKDYEQHLFEHCQKTLALKPQKREDMAVLLLTMGYMDSAIKLLENHLDSPSKQWMYMDCLLETKQYLRCLDYINQSPPSSFSPEMTSELNYYKAYSYYGLKEYQKARNIIQNLISMKPDHQPALTLLWLFKEEKIIP